MEIHLKIQSWKVKRAVQNGLKYRKYYYIKEQHRFTLYDDKMTTIGDEVEIPLMDTGVFNCYKYRTTYF